MNNSKNIQIEYKYETLPICKLKLNKNTNAFNDIKKLWVLKRPIQLIKKLKNGIKTSKQRSKYGISKSDSYDFGIYLNYIVENGLKFLKNEGNSYPIECSYEEWHSKLNHMIKLCEFINSDDYEATKDVYQDFLTKKDKFGKESEITEKARRVWLDEENCLAKRKSEACKELYNEIGKYIYELWD